MDRFLVAGGHGFIGSNLVAFLKSKGHWVRAVDWREHVFRKPLYGQADEDWIADMREIEQVKRAVDGVDGVFWLCSDMGGVGYFTANDYYPYFNNMRMDLNALGVCEMRNKRLFYSSSACAYPTYLQEKEGEAPKLYEELLEKPAAADQMYGWEKLMTTKLCQRAKHVDARVGIFHTIYGVYQEYEGERMKAPTALATKAIKSLETGQMEVWGNGKQQRSFEYIDDALEKIYRIMMAEQYEGPVNVGSDQSITIGEVAQLCRSLVGSEAEIAYTTDKPTGVLARNCDNTKFEKLYGYRSQIGYEEGFARLIDWLKTVV